MRIQPREQILRIWEAMIRQCWVENGGRWAWGGVRPRNSISDSEQLLCLLYPATEIDVFALHDLDRIEPDVRAVLDPVSATIRIGDFVVQLLTEYIDGNSTDSGEPVFSGGSYLESGLDGAEPTEGQRQLEIVDSYSMSLTVCVAGLRFLRDYRARSRSTRKEEQLDRLSEQLSVRLTAAMTGLVRSFVVNTVRPSSSEGQAILAMLNQTGRPQPVVLASIRTALERVRARLRSDVTLGAEESVLELEDETLLFECGWSWGVTTDATDVKFVDSANGTTPGIAEARPYLYFTVVALDGINDLVSPRAGELGLLNETQHRLAQALRTRWELTQSYWSIIARYGEGRWPLEDIPWRTSDGEQSDYYSLIVSAVLIQDLIARNASDDDLTRAVAIFDELAGRGRIIRRPLRDDQAVALHDPGVPLSLRGSEKVDGGPQLTWQAADFSTVLLKRMLQTARLSNNVAARDKLMELSKATMDHLQNRIVRKGSIGLWDDPAGAFDEEDDTVVRQERKPSWYLTERVIECLVSAEQTYREAPPNWPDLQSIAQVMLNTAEHRFDREMLGVRTDDKSAKRVALDKVERLIDEARKLLRQDAATSFVHTVDALRELDGLATARRDAKRNA